MFTLYEHMNINVLIFEALCYLIKWLFPFQTQKNTSIVEYLRTLGSIDNELLFKHFFHYA